MTEVRELTRKDFVSDQTVRWCPGCGDYAILAQMQRVLPDLGIPKEKIVFISGIGCSSRFPYYMETYGIHSIHGRAPTLATGLKIANPDLSVWVITGDGDGLSIGGNHLLHALRRNVDINIILFNNRIYGLTKGQYSPTTPKGQKTKSSPMGSIEQPLNPLSVAIAAEATFVARTIDTNVRHLAEVLKRAAEHKGTSFVEIYQNCVIFNDKAWEYATDAKVKTENILELEHGQPMIFGKDRDKGVRISGLDPEIVSLDKVSEKELLVHNEQSPASRAYFLSRMRYPQFPEPIGVFRAIERPVYEQELFAQIGTAVQKKGKGDLRKLYHSANTWEVLPEAGHGNGHNVQVDQIETRPSEFDEEYVGVMFHGEGTSERKAEHSLLIDTLAGLRRDKMIIAPVELTLAQAITQLQQEHADFMALIDDRGKLVGVFTETDILSKVACNIEDLAQASVKDYMTSNVTTLRSGATIAQALHLMSMHQFRHIPLVDEAGKPDGVISFRSVIHYLETNFPSNGNK
jgi:2-oxoglutarate ferredoxin oxidoreductase subunit beta